MFSSTWSLWKNIKTRVSAPHNIDGMVMRPWLVLRLFCPISSFNLPTSDVFFTCSQLKRAGAARRSPFFIHQLDSTHGCCSPCVVFAQSLRGREDRREKLEMRARSRTGWCARACVRAGERPKQTHVVHLKKSLTYRFCARGSLAEYN